jgi:hypothetical protein
MPGFNGTQHGRRDRWNWDHQKERARLKPIVEAGHAYCQQGIPGNGSSGTCLMRSRWIEPGSTWVLGHNDAGTAHIGPVHAVCNTNDAAVRGARKANARRADRRHPRPWPPRRQGLPQW